MNSDDHDKVLDPNNPKHAALLKSLRRYAETHGHLKPLIGEEETDRASKLVCNELSATHKIIRFMEG